MATDDERQKRQVGCLVAEEGAGARYIYLYDRLPKAVQRLVRENEFNLCLECLRCKANQYGKHTRRGYEPDYRGAIRDINAEIRQILREDPSYARYSDIQPRTS